MTVNALGQTLTATDRNGNVHEYSYDVLGRVISDAVTTLGAGVDGRIRRIDTAYDAQGNAALITSYAYDGRHRRVQETAGGTTTDLYYSDSWQLLEKRVASGGTSVPRAQYVWSPVYVDALILRDRDTNGDGTLDERLWVVQDANLNVTALFDNAGNVVERYVYDPFGQATVLDANWNVLAGSAFAWVYLHQGGRFDAASGLYHFRHRDYSPTLGRWTSLDPLRYDAGDFNLYRSLGNASTNRLDPSGLLWSWLSAGIGAVIGAGVGVVGYVGYNALTGRPITWGGVAGAASGGAVAGGIAGGFVGAATGDPSALVVVGGGVLICAGSGAAGGFTSSVVSQAIDEGRINWGQVAVDTGTGAVIGGVTGGVLGAGRVVLRPRPGVFKHGDSEAITLPLNGPIGWPGGVGRQNKLLRQSKKAIPPQRRTESTQGTQLQGMSIQQRDGR